MKRILVAAILVVMCLPAYGQWQTPNHSVPVGRGAGTGFKSVGPCDVGYVVTGNGASADPSCQSSPSVSIKAPVDLATTANITLSGEQTIDGVLTSGSRVLVKDQSTASENGIYVSDAGAWIRATDFNATGQVVQGTQVFVTQGGKNANQTFAVTSVNPITIGASSIPFGGLASTATGSTTSRSLSDRNLDIGFNLKDFGCVGDGVADDTVCVQAATDAAVNSGYNSVVYAAPSAKYRLTSSISCYSANTLTYRSLGYEAATFITDYSGVDSSQFDCTHPTVPSTRSGHALVFEDLRFQYGSGVTGIGPVFISKRYATDFTLRHVRMSAYGKNTALSVSACYNCQIDDLHIYGSGIAFPSKSANGITFSITSGATTLTSSASVFAADDVTSPHGFVFGDTGEVVKICSYVSATEVTTCDPAVATHTAATGVFTGVTGSISLGSPTTLTLNNDVMTSDDIGRIIYIPKAFAGGSGQLYLLRAKITNVSGTTITLDTPATAAVTDVYIVPSPGIEIYREDTTANYTNDLKSYNTRVEYYNGTGMVLDWCIECNLYALKLHQQTTPITDASNSLFTLVGDNLQASFSGTDFEQYSANTLGRAYVIGQNAGALFSDWLGIAQNGIKLIFSEGNHANGYIQLGNVAVASNMPAAFWYDPLYMNPGFGKILGTLGSFQGPPSTLSGRIIDQSTNTVSTAFAVQHNTSGTPAVGFGTALAFKTFTSPGVVVNGSKIDSVATNVGVGSESFDTVLNNYLNGSSVETKRFLAAGGDQTIIRTAPTTPSLGYGKSYFDSTTKTFTALNSDGTKSNTVVPDAGSSNNFLTAISSSGVISKAQPTIGNLASIATNTVVGNSTSGSAAPTALAVGSCSTASSALIWTTNTGFGCNTAITAAAVPASGITGQVAIANGGTAASTAQAASLNMATTFGVAQSAVQVSHTDDTVETTLATITIPANALGANGCVNITATADATANTNTKTFKLKFGGALYTTINLSTASTISATWRNTICNRNNTASQVGNVVLGSTGAGGWGVLNGNVITSAIDTTSPVDITITGQAVTSGTDTVSLEMYQVELKAKN